ADLNRRELRHTGHVDRSVAADGGHRPLGVPAVFARPVGDRGTERDRAAKRGQRRGCALAQAPGFSRGLDLYPRVPAAGAGSPIRRAPWAPRRHYAVESLSAVDECPARCVLADLPVQRAERVAWVVVPVAVI